MSMVDARSGVGHLVAVETAAVHRRAGRYPALCGMEVIIASMLAEPEGQCRDCQHRAQAGAGAARQRGRAGSRRSGESRPRRARRRIRRTRRRRPNNRDGSVR